MLFLIIASPAVDRIKFHETVCVIQTASRAKMMAVKSISKLRGQTNHTLYPQPEGQLGECMTKYGKDLGEDSLYGMFYALWQCY